MGINEEIKKAMAQVHTETGISVKKQMKISFGDKKLCRILFERTFRGMDKTMKEFNFLPEYEPIIEWMADNEGRGLLLIGSVGRGKSIILMNVLPVLFRLMDLKFRPYNSADLSAMKRPDLIELTARKKLIGIDEMGREPLGNDFGIKHESLEYVINDCEFKMKLLFVTTNMNLPQIEKRYGKHILSRIERLCKIVPFVGPDLRPK